MDTGIRTGVIEVDGADLYYERRGSGPALLMIHGGVGDCGSYAPVADLLADEYTVLTYDRRGNSRSPLRDPAPRDAPLRLAEQSADALAVLAHNGFTDALVFGSSAGAVIGLDLATRSPRSVAGLVAHEPPAITVLPDAAERIAFFAELDRVRAQDGTWPAFAWFTLVNSRVDPPGIFRYRPVRRLAGAALGGTARRMSGGRPPWIVRAAVRTVRLLLRRPAPDPADAVTTRRRDDMLRALNNVDFFVNREMRSIIDYTPDIGALVAGRAPILLAGGQDSRQFYYSRAGQVLAQRLGVGYVEFPGGHTGYVDRAPEFAPVLRETLATLREEPARS